MTGYLPREKVIAHRGSSYAAPENTLAALKLAIDEKAGAVEFDVRISHDLVPFLFSGADLGKLGDPKQLVRDLSWDEIQKIDVGRHFSPLHAGETIPDLIEALTLIEASDLEVHCELKSAPRGFESVMITSVLAAIEEVGSIKERMHLLSYEPELLVELRAQECEIPTGMVYDRVPDNWIEEANFLGISALYCNIDTLSPEEVEEVNLHGYRLYVHTANNPRRLENFDVRFIDGLLTDCPMNFLVDRLHEADLERFERMVLREAAEMAERRQDERERMETEHEKALRVAEEERRRRLAVERQAEEIEALERQEKEKEAQQMERRRRLRARLEQNTSELEREVKVEEERQEEIMRKFEESLDAGKGSDGLFGPASDLLQEAGSTDDGLELLEFDISKRLEQTEHRKYKTRKKRKNEIR